MFTQNNPIKRLSKCSEQINKNKIQHFEQFEVKTTFDYFSQKIQNSENMDIEKMSNIDISQDSVKSISSGLSTLPNFIALIYSQIIEYITTSN